MGATEPGGGGVCEGRAGRKGGAPWHQSCALHAPGTPSAKASPVDLGMGIERCMLLHAQETDHIVLPFQMCQLLL